MRSRVLGKVELDAARLASELAKILDFELREEYSEYTFGTWRSYVLANSGGNERDTSFRGYDGLPRKTALGRELPYLGQVIEETLDTDRLKWERIFLIHNGLLISHRDFVEFEEPFVRLNVPLATHSSCLHSEEDVVFHMREGEVWYLDARTVHSACSLFDFRRISLCLDFSDDGRPLEEWVRPPFRSAGEIAPQLVEREPLTDEFKDGLMALSKVLTRENFREVVGLLGRVHFYRQAHAAEVFDWLVEIARRCDDPELAERSAAFKRFCIEQRALGERFDFPTRRAREMAA